MGSNSSFTILPSNSNFFIIFFLLILLAPHCRADEDFGGNTILQGQELRDDQYLDSASKTFRLRFISPDTRLKSRYLSILFNDVFDDPRDRFDSSVWIANRNNPIPDASGVLMIDGSDGMLKISHNRGKSTFVVSDTDHKWRGGGGSSNNRSLTLMDDGNLVLREMNTNGSINRSVIWQSFDYPTDVFLPGMRLGINFRTGHRWSLTSRINSEVPGSGSFTMGGDPNGTSQLIMWWQGEVYWRSGLWRNGRFGNSPSVAVRRYIRFSYVVNEDEKYFTYSVNGSNKLVAFGLRPDGSFRGTGETRIFSDCKRAEAGCVKPTECREGHFEVEMEQGDMYGESYRFDQNYQLMNLEDCKKKCQLNCSCLAFASINRDGTGCEIWSNGTEFSKSQTPFRYRNIYWVTTHRRGGHIPEVKMKMLKWLIPAVCGSILTFIALYCTWRKKFRIKASMRNIKKLLLNVFTRPREYKSSNDKRYKKLGFWCYALQRHLARLKRKKKEEVNVESGHGLANTITHSRKYADAIDKIEKRLSQIHRFSFACIETATHYFSAGNKLGEGGFGPVYKGELPGGKEVAIKRLSRSSGQGLVEFKNEILLIAKLQHNNLVRLIGYCSQGKEMMLVYEYMPNKSLDHFLFDPKRSKLLKWTQRVNIIEGVAQGLLYLHKHSRLRVIHRDLKASNILLDQNMNPKISDFGLARIFQKQDLETNTNTIVGTQGYMSPEYLMKGTVSAKTDVFSFGVLVLEIISGKRNRDSYHSERPLNLIGLAWELWMEGRCLELMDTTMLEISTQKNKVNRCITIGLLCVQDNAADRPSMTDVVSMLTSELLPLPTPKQPAFFIKTSTHKVDKEGASNKNCTNSLSISVMEAR